MIYICILILLCVVIVELIGCKRTLTPTIAMVSIWLLTLILCAFYEHEFWSLSNDILFWITFGCVTFFIGGILGRMFSKRQVSIVVISRAPRSSIVPVYFLMFFVFYFMVRSGGEVSSNWYVGIRTIINYGKQDWFFNIFGYIYYVIYPALYVSAIKFYASNDNRNGFDRNTYLLHLFMCMMYAFMSTAKLKLLLVVVPVLIIRNYYKPISIRSVFFIFLGFLSVFLTSLILLNKMPSNDDFFKSIFVVIANYTFFNVFALSYIDINRIVIDSCVDTSNVCSFLPFFYSGDYKTNIYTIMYSFAEYGFGCYFLFQFAIGFFHNYMDKVAKISHNPFALLFSAVLYVPLVFQVMDNQYTASKYIVYITVVSCLMVIMKSRIYFFHINRK